MSRFYIIISLSKGQKDPKRLMWNHHRPSSWMRLGQVSNNGPDQNFASNCVPLTCSSEGEISQSSNLKSFSFKELNTATKNFYNDNLLRIDCFGNVFKGWIDEHMLTATKPGSGIAVAIKRFNLQSMRSDEEWLADINNLGKLCHPNLGKLCHPNLGKLLGYCLEQELHKEHLLLVYEFMPRGSLTNHLTRRGSNCHLSWGICMKIALGAAKALAFLHNADINAIHWGCQDSIILLDSNYNAKLSEFGLSGGGRICEGYTTICCCGYACPEYVATGRLTAKGDVYSFGVDLLEILSGRKVKDMSRPLNEQNLVTWAKPYLNNKRKILHVLDSHLNGQYTVESALKAIHLVIQCLADEAKRPNMDVVVTALEQLQE